MLGAPQRLAGSTSVWYQEVISVWRNASKHLIKLHCSRFGSSAAASAAGAMVSGSGPAARSLLDAARHGLSRTVLAGGIATALGVGWLFSSPDLGAQLTHARHVPIRLARDVVAAGSIIADYTISLRGLEGEELAQERRRCHERGAQRLLELCFANGGIYIKLGQHIGQLDHLLPEPYVRTMRDHALDKCPVSSMDAVRQTFMDDLGVAPEQAFAEFDPRPIASASLAQVHRAVAHDGRELAVKVQHPGLRESSAADISTVSILVNLIAAWFPAYNYRWLVEEIQENLPKELDFLQEADNAEACRANLASPRSHLGSQVVVPDIERELTSRRVLTMEFVHGVGVADVDGISALGFRAAAVARLVARAFSEMIFTHGHVHCDPHEANMLVRCAPGSGALQLVLLDHGLYRQIDDSFRRAYAQLWRSLVLADERGIREHSQSMNAGDLYPIFASMLTVRTWDNIIRCSSDHLLLSNSASDRKTIARYAKEYRQEISELLLRMPRALLLLLKTNDCLRSVDRRLGQPVNTFVITARECTRALGQPAGSTGTSFATKLSAQVVGVVERARIEWQLFLLQLLSVWSSASIRLHALLLGPAAPGS